MRSDHCLGQIMVAAVIAVIFLVMVLRGALGQERYDLCLVLLIDASGSVDGAEWQEQTGATAEALASPEIVSKITAGAHGQVAIMALAWSEHVETMVAWSPIHDQASAVAVGYTIARHQRGLSGSTAVGTALLAAVSAMEIAPPCDKRVVDISSDGTNNHGSNPLLAAAALSMAGISLNALVIDDGTEPGLFSFYEALTAETGGFTRTATWESYAQAIRAKLTLEIAGLQ